MARLPGTLEGMISPEICVVMAAASRTMPDASMQLKPAHMAVEPVSAAMTGANFAPAAPIRSAALLSSSRRAAGAIAAQAGNAAAAASTARLASAALAAAAREATPPVMGLSRSKVALPAALVGIVDHQVYGNHGLAPGGCFVGLWRGDGRCRSALLQRRLGLPRHVSCSVAPMRGAAIPQRPRSAVAAPASGRGPAAMMLAVAQAAERPRWRAPGRCRHCRRRPDRPAAPPDRRAAPRRSLRRQCGRSPADTHGRRWPAQPVRFAPPAARRRPGP